MEKKIGIGILISVITVGIILGFLLIPELLKSEDIDPTISLFFPTPTSARPTAPQSNHPADIITSISGLETINWILMDTVGSGKYRVWVNDTNNNYYVWQDWTNWINNFNLQIPINRNVAGVFNYTIEYNNSNGLFGIPDTVIVTIISAQPPTSNHPVDITISTTGSKTIDWILWDAVGSAKYRVWANDTNNNYYVWKDWSDWANNTNLQVSINNSYTGVFNYTIEYNNSNGLFGIPDIVMVNVTDIEELTEINPIAKFQDCSANITYSLGFTSGNNTIDGATIIGNFNSSIECSNVTSITRDWISVVLFNDAQLNIINLDRDLVVQSFDFSSVKIDSLTANYSLSIILHDFSSININYLNNINPSEYLSIYTYGNSSGTINGSNFDTLYTSGSSSISISSSTIELVYSLEKSNLMLVDCNITDTLHNGIYITSGTLIVNSMSLLGSYINTTTLISCSVNAKTLGIYAYGTSTINLQSNSGNLGIYGFDNSHINATGSINGYISIIGREFTNISISGVKNDQIYVLGDSNSTVSIINSNLGTSSFFGYSQVNIKSSNLSSISTDDYSQVLLTSNSNVPIAFAHGFSNLKINSSTITNLEYGIYYSAGNITIDSGVFPGGYNNCYTLIGSPPPITTWKYVFFGGSSLATISGNTPDLEFWACENSTMNLESVSSNIGGFRYWDNSRGDITNSDVCYITLFRQKQFSITIDNTDADYIEVTSFYYIILIKNNSNIQTTKVGIIP